MKGVGMLVVSLRGVNFGFWPHLGCSGQKNIEIYIFNMYIFNSSYLLHSYNPSFSFVCVLTWSFFPVSSRFALPQFRGAEYLETWNRLVVFGIFNDCLKRGIQFHHSKF